MRERLAYRLTLRPLPGADGDRCLKALLKSALRQHQLQCVACEEVSDVLVGSHVRATPCVCGTDVAVIGPGNGPHAHSLRCIHCNRHRGWLSKAAAIRLHEATSVS